MLDFLSIQPEQLFYIGIAIGVFALGYAIIASIFLIISKKRINHKLEQEFGKKVR